MSGLPRILVGVDFSDCSHAVLAEARRLAHALAAQIDLVHIAPLAPINLGQLPSFNDPFAAAARRRLEMLEHEMRSQGDVVKVHLGVGAPVAGLLDFIHHLRPQLIVLGSHGKGMLERMVVGSVAESVLRRSTVPVVVVPPPDRRAAAAAQ